jgi:hypothetical protein
VVGDYVPRLLLVGFFFLGLCYHSSLIRGELALLGLCDLRPQHRHLRFERRRPLPLRRKLHRRHLVAECRRGGLRVEPPITSCVSASTRRSQHIVLQRETLAMKDLQLLDVGFERTRVLCLLHVAAAEVQQEAA